MHHSLSGREKGETKTSLWKLPILFFLQYFQLFSKESLLALSWVSYQKFTGIHQTLSYILLCSIVSLLEAVRTGISGQIAFYKLKFSSPLSHKEKFPNDTCFKYYHYLYYLNTDVNTWNHQEKYFSFIFPVTFSWFTSPLPLFLLFLSQLISLHRVQFNSLFDPFFYPTHISMPSFPVSKS